MRELADADVRPLLEQITSDVFLIAGDRDEKLAALYAEEMNEELRSSQLIAMQTLDTIRTARNRSCSTP